jgi:hypothetical protein
MTLHTNWARRTLMESLGAIAGAPAEGGMSSLLLAREEEMVTEHLVVRLRAYTA